MQIKRADPTTTHLVSEPACCPYCVQPDFGVVYTPPPWRAGINSEGAVSRLLLGSLRIPHTGLLAVTAIMANYTNWTIIGYTTFCSDETTA